MARRRLYLPLVVDYFDDEALMAACDVSPWAEHLFLRCSALAKRGRTDGHVSPQMLAKSRVPNASRWAALLVQVGLWDEAEGGFVIRSFLKHNLTAEQIERKRAETAARVAAHRERAKAARVTDPNESPTDPGNAPCNSDGNAARNALPLRKKVEGRRHPTDELLEPETADAVVVPHGQRPRDLLFDALAVLAEGVPIERFDALTKRQARSIGVAAAEIRRAGGEPKQVRPAVAAYREQFPGATLTANALAAHWARLQPGNGPQPPQPARAAAGGAAARMAEHTRRIATEMAGAEIVPLHELGAGR